MLIQRGFSLDGGWAIVRLFFTVSRTLAQQPEGRHEAYELGALLHQFQGGNEVLGSKSHDALTRCFARLWETEVERLPQMSCAASLTAEMEYQNFMNLLFRVAQRGNSSALEILGLRSAGKSKLHILFSICLVIHSIRQGNNSVSKYGSYVHSSEWIGASNV